MTEPKSTFLIELCQYSPVSTEVASILPLLIFDAPNFERQLLSSVSCLDYIMVTSFTLFHL